MPQFIGSQIIDAICIEDNAITPLNYIRLTYSQAILLPPNLILKSLNTTDKGSKGNYAKRWYNWFGNINDILLCNKSTKLMRSNASKYLIKYIIE